MKNTNWVSVPMSALWFNSVFVGPLSPEETLRVPSDQIVHVDLELEARDVLDEHLQTIPGFTRCHSLGEWDIRANDESTVDRIEQLGIDLDVNKHLELYGILDTYKAHDASRDEICKLAKSVPVLIHHNMKNISRRKGMIVDKFQCKLSNPLWAVRYDLAEWEKRKKAKAKANKLKQLMDAGIIHERVARYVYWIMVQVLVNKITRNREFQLEPVAPGPYKTNIIKSTIDVYKVGTKLFGKNFWKRVLKRRDVEITRHRWRLYVDLSGIGADSVANYYASFAPVFKRYIQSRSKKRPPAKAKLDRFYWDLAHGTI